ncbi:MAG: NUDIX hydrolase [Chloroflexi bacterium OLB14]|nr:MAG: NUDIX hydrolase [Chloroflexi bacterium OLB14]
MSQLTLEFIIQKLSQAQKNNIDSDGYAEIAIKPNTKLRKASVLIPLTYFQNEWHILFTRRTDKVESHKGQVSFPGGASEDGETDEQTALRETEEEIGVHANDIKIIGKLSRMITISKFQVSPVAGVIPFPYAFKIQNAEVARVFTIPLLWLANKNNFWEFTLRDSNRSVIAYHPYDGELLWGATARMTVNFLKLLDLIT